MNLAKVLISYNCFLVTRPNINGIIICLYRWQTRISLDIHFLKIIRLCIIRTEHPFELILLNVFLNVRVLIIPSLWIGNWVVILRISFRRNLHSSSQMFRSSIYQIHHGVPFSFVLIPLNINIISIFDCRTRKLINRIV
jgi:hypothetical protein